VTSAATTRPIAASAHARATMGLRAAVIPSTPW
jgi:hypothetical protein